MRRHHRRGLLNCLRLSHVSRGICLVGVGKSGNARKCLDYHPRFPLTFNPQQRVYPGLLSLTVNEILDNESFSGLSYFDPAADTFSQILVLK